MQHRHSMLAWVAAVLCLALQLPSCSGHAYLADPIARNWLNAHKQPTNFYDEMSLNNLGTGLCGGQRPTDSRFAVAPSPKRTADDGVMATGQITKTYTQGQEIKVRIHISTAHWGRFELRLCPLSDASAATERKQFTEACLAKYPLVLSPKSYQPGITDASKRYYYFTRADQTASDVYATFILPKSVTCTRCVMQWRWVTGNSCYAPGTLESWKQSITYNIPQCPPDYLSPKSQPEKFWNCADIAIRRAGPTPAPTKPKPTPKPKVTVKKPAPTPAPTPRKVLTPTPKAPTPTAIKAPTPTAPTLTVKAPTPSASTPVVVGGKKVAPAWQQCGGLWGNPAYQGLDAPWPDTTCAAGSTCTKLSSDYYQCRV